jgi:hypothetical protein
MNMGIHKARLLCAATISLLLGACASGFQATYDYDRSHDFSGHRYWAWISEHPMKIGEIGSIPSPLIEPRIMSAIDGNLSRKGFERVDDPAAADFVVAFTIGSREKIKVDTYPSYYGGYAYPRRWGGSYYGGGYSTETRVSEYTKGMLAIDIFDASEKVPTWHGATEKSITSTDRKNVEETINAAVTAVLKGFPPGGN